MQKKSLLYIILPVFLINIVSAYTNFSFSYLLNKINPVSIVTFALFFIFFAFINYILSKVFRDREGNVNKMTAGIISFCSAVLIIFWGRGLISEIVSGIQLSETIFYVIGAIAFLLFLLWARKRIRFCGLLMILGAGLVIIGFTDLLYRNWFPIIVGIVLFILGLLWCIKRKKKLSGPSPMGPQGPPGSSGQTPPPQIIREQRNRSIYDLRQKYRSYLFEYHNYRKNPQRQKRIKQAMKIIINQARKQGISRKRFLGNMKAPPQLK